MRRLTPADVDLLRTLRLGALSDAPDAFGSSYEREAAFTTEWEQRLRDAASAHFVCEAAGRAVGLAAGVPDEQDRHVVHLVGMWVAPEARGSGAAALLVRAVQDWARAREQVATVRLYVVAGNVAAQRLYERHGFVATGRAYPRDRGGSYVEMEWATGG